MKKFKFLEHTADVKFQAFGKTIEKAFENSALAMINVTYKEKVIERKKIKIKAQGKDMKSLLYNFLEEIIILFDSENFLLSKVKIKIDKKNFKLEAILLGDNSENYELGTYVKAVTYNDMFIKQEDDKWVIQVVLDV